MWNLKTPVHPVFFPFCRSRNRVFMCTNTHHLFLPCQCVLSSSAGMVFTSSAFNALFYLRWKRWDTIFIFCDEDWISNFFVDTFVLLYNIHIKSSSVTGQPGQRCKTKFKIAKLLLTLVVTARCLENVFQSTLYFNTILGVQITIIMH